MSEQTLPPPPPTAGVFAQPTPPPLDAERSIVDTILDLDEFLSGEVRLAEKSVRFVTKPDLEARVDELEAQLEQVLESEDTDEASLGEESTAQVLAAEIQAVRREMTASVRTVRVRQLPGDQWKAFTSKHEKAMEKGGNDAMWNELIVACAVAPRFRLDQIQAMRKKMGHPAVQAIASGCFAVCSSSGVSVPKSYLSSRVLKQKEPDES